MPLDSVVFDLDGTLWDASPATVVAWNQVVQEVGAEFRPITVEDVRRVTGKPHEQAVFETFEGLPAATVERICDLTLTRDGEAIAEHGSLLYDGVREGLHALAAKTSLFIVSNCQRGYIELFLSMSELQPLFSDWECWGNTGEPKPENLRRVIARNGLQSPLMVGDTDGDEAAARSCGIPFAFMAYGFGSAEAPSYRFSSFSELTAHVFAETG